MVTHFGFCTSRNAHADFARSVTLLRLRGRECSIPTDPCRQNLHGSEDHMRPDTIQTLWTIATESSMQY